MFASLSADLEDELFHVIELAYNELREHENDNQPVVMELASILRKYNRIPK